LYGRTERGINPVSAAHRESWRWTVRWRPGPAGAPQDRAPREPAARQGDSAHSPSQTEEVAPAPAGSAEARGSSPRRSPAVSVARPRAGRRRLRRATAAPGCRAGSARARKPRP